MKGKNRTSEKNVFHVNSQILAALESEHSPSAHILPGNKQFATFAVFPCAPKQLKQECVTIFVYALHIRHKFNRPEALCCLANILSYLRLNQGMSEIINVTM